MSGFLLDTNIPSEFRNPRPEPQVVHWLDSIPQDSVFISVVTLGEIRKGCELLDFGKRREGLERWLEVEVRASFADRILPVTEAIAERWGRLEAKRQRLGHPLNTADGQIAATALEHGLILATRNVNDFRDLGLTLFNPWDSFFEQALAEKFQEETPASPEKSRDIDR